MMLTDEVPGPSGGIEPTVRSPNTVRPATPPEISKLVPEDGETAVFYLSGYHGSAGGGYTLEKGETFVSWTCDGFGPFGIAFSDGTGFDARCEDFQVNQVNRTSFTSTSRHRVEIEVGAEERQLWQVLVTQKAR